VPVCKARELNFIALKKRIRKVSLTSEHEIEVSRPTAGAWDWQTTQAQMDVEPSLSSEDSRAAEGTLWVAPMFA